MANCWRSCISHVFLCIFVCVANATTFRTEEEQVEEDALVEEWLKKYRDTEFQRSEEQLRTNMLVKVNVSGSACTITSTVIHEDVEIFYEPWSSIPPTAFNCRNVTYSIDRLNCFVQGSAEEVCDSEGKLKKILKRLVFDGTSSCTELEAALALKYDLGVVSVDLVAEQELQCHVHSVQNAQPSMPKLRDAQLHNG